LETLGNQIGNIRNNHLELGENMLGTIWNIMGTPKIVENPPAPPSKRKKEPILWVHAGSPHWVPRIFYVDNNGKDHELWGHRLKEFGHA
jgi:hypothetical protein